MVIWQILDGRAGHDNQTRGLSEALVKLSGASCYSLSAPEKTTSMLQWLSCRFPAGGNLPAPDLIIGAGHRTHPALLAAKRRFGGKTVVLMKPSLPTWLFDLCIVPEHDDVKENAHILLSKGVLNPMHPGHTGDHELGLLLIGGPSKHTIWDENTLISQIHSILDSNSNHRFILTTSRRTPASFVEKMHALKAQNFNFIPIEDTKSDWLVGVFNWATEAWVTADSVSMVYEAITADVAVGVLELESRGSNRVSRGLAKLIDDELVTTYSDWVSGKRLSKPSCSFNEATRCAKLVMTRWPTLEQNRTSSSVD